MRQPIDICLLCNEKNSTKENSHLIPKFFGKGIFYGTKPRHGILIDNNGTTTKIQDIIKEDYLFCADCEKGFSIFETYCSLRLERLNNLRYFNQFKKFKRGEFEYLECKDLDIRIFNLFIYSIVWRVSISNHYGFLKFKLPTQKEEELRKVLKEYIVPTQNALIDKLEKLKELPNHSHVMIRPNKKLRPPSSMLSGASINDCIHQLHLVDYLIFYITDRDRLVEGFREIDNNNLDKLVRIGLTDPKLWESFNFDLINKMMK